MSYTELTNKEVKCAKTHLCCWCYGKLKAGEKAIYRSYIADSDFNSDYMHLDCYDAMTGSARHYTAEGWDFGMFERGQLAEHYDG